MKMSHKRRWTIKNIKEGIKRFYSEYRRYPVARDFDMYEYLPSARQIQRSFGGLVELRKNLKIKTQIDYRKGSYSSNRSRKSKEQSKTLKDELKNILEKSKKLDQLSVNYRYAKMSVIIDFWAKYKAQNWAIEGFYSKDDRTFVGCINNKVRRFERIEKSLNKIFLVSMNYEYTGESIEKILSRRKNKLNKKIFIYSLKDFRRKVLS